MTTGSDETPTHVPTAVETARVALNAALHLVAARESALDALVDQYHAAVPLAVGETMARVRREMADVREHIAAGKVAVARAKRDLLLAQCDEAEREVAAATEPAEAARAAYVAVDAEMKTGFNTVETMVERPRRHLDANRALGVARTRLNEGRVRRDALLPQRMQAERELQALIERTMGRVARDATA